MVKRISLTCIAALLMGQMSFAFEPHHEPLIKQNPPKPNIYMILDTSGSMDEVDIPKEGMSINYKCKKSSGWWSKPDPNCESRINVLKRVVTNLFERYRYDAYMGYGTLGYLGYKYTGSGTRSYDYNVVKMPISDLSDDDSLKNAKNQISGIVADGGTPLAFSLYETAKYFRGEDMLDNFNWGIVKSRGTLKNPIRYRCQQQHIILMTDGAPMGDITGPIIKRDKDYFNVGRLSDSISNQRTSKVGEFLWNLDLLTDATNLGSTDNADQYWDSTGAVDKMPIYLNAITFGSDTSSNDQKELKNTVKYSGGVHVEALNATALYVAFHDIFQSIIKTRSGTGAVMDQFIQTTNSIRYSTSYIPGDWTGEIIAKAYNSKKKSFSKIKWSSKDTIKPNDGEFYTSNDGYLNGNYLFNEKVNLDKANIQSSYVKWLKGESPKNLRMRNDNLLGAIINSDIAHYANDVPYINLRYMQNNIQKEFINYIKLRREKMKYSLLIAGSNDGLINFIYSDKSNTPGRRYVSYFPSFFKDDLADITSIYYTHKFKVDGKTHFFDAIDDDTFRSLGITSMASGSRGLVGYQLFSASRDNVEDYSKEFQVNFEITNQTKGFENLGYTYSEIDFINHLHNGSPRAVAIFGNGFGAKTSSIYFIDAVTGTLINEIVLDDDGGGAASPALVVSNNASTGFQKLDALYVGDYSGKLYKIVFSGASSNFDQAEHKVLFDAGGKEAPISTRPILHKPEKDAMWVYFGTGKALEKDDISAKALIKNHYVYGIKDLDKKISASQLHSQNLLKIENIIGNSSLQALTTTKHHMSNDENHLGWKLSLKIGENNYERVILSPVLVYNPRGTSLQVSTWSAVLGKENDPCLSDTVMGSLITLNLFDGSASDTYAAVDKDGEPIYEIDDQGNSIPVYRKYNGIHSKQDAYGRSTGGNIEGNNPYGGNYYSYFIEELYEGSTSYVKRNDDDTLPEGVHTDTYYGDSITELLPGGGGGGGGGGGKPFCELYPTHPYCKDKGLKPGRLYLKTIAIN